MDLIPNFSVTQVFRSTCDALSELLLHSAPLARQTLEHGRGEAAISCHLASLGGGTEESYFGVDVTVFGSVYLLDIFLGLGFFGHGNAWLWKCLKRHH